jgi:hypothetical protein
MATTPLVTSGPSFEELQNCACAVLEADFLNRDDFTIFYTDNKLRNRSGQVPGSDWWLRYCCAKVRIPYDPAKPLTSFEFQEEVKSKEARLQVSRARNGSGWSVSVRWSPPPGLPPYEPPTREQRDEWLENSPWKPPEGYKLEQRAGSHEGWVLFSILDIVEVLYDLILSSETRAQGLVLFTGPTNAAKSECARGLIWKHLQHLSSTRQRLHLVTYEDPIEKPFAPRNHVAPAGPNRAFPAFDLTQRCAPADCGSLEEALTAALRQTPDAFYIGEIRKGPDLLRALEFGGTGH